MVRAPGLARSCVSDEDRRRILDWCGWRPGAEEAESMSPGEEVRWMVETCPRGAEFEELVRMSEKYIAGAGESLVMRRLDEDLVEDRSIVFFPLHRFM